MGRRYEWAWWTVGRLALTAIFVTSCSTVPTPTPTAEGLVPSDAAGSSDPPLPELDFEPLPPLADLPPGTPEQVAAELARRVRAGGTEGTAALLAALNAAGFPMRNADGSLMGTASSGIVMPEW